MSALFEHARAWLDRRGPELSSLGVRVTATAGTPDRPKRSICVDLESDRRLARVVIWDSGEAVVTVGDLQSGEVVVEEQRDLSGSFGVRQTLDDALASL